MYFNKSIEETFEMLESGTDGLSEEEFCKRLAEEGENRLMEAGRKNVIQIFLGQFADLLVIILIIAAAVSFFTGNSESTIVIAAVVVLNAIMGTIQHVKAEKSLAALKDLSAPGSKVIRNGSIREVDSRKIVTGDLVLLEAGDKIPADGRLVECFSMQTNESPLTGESGSVSKTDEIITEEKVALGDMKNMVFAGTTVVYGRGKAVITHTGMSTEVGKIAELMNSAKERKTPLQATLDRFSKKLSAVILVVCAAVMALDLARGMHVTDALMFAVALAVAAIPEALASVVTISLALGTSKMAKANAIIKNLSAVEGLGCVSVICSDKTGTLTQNKMKITDIWSPCGDTDLLGISSILCNDSISAGGSIKGDPTETAMVDWFRSQRADYTQVMEEYPRLYEVPFDSNRKMMSTVHKMNDRELLIAKGAVDVIVNRCTCVQGKDSIMPLEPVQIAEITQKSDALSERGLRVLAFAFKYIGEKDKEDGIDEADEKELIFSGLMAMADPPREESSSSVEQCIKAGIKPIMITGDHKITASAIAKQIGIMNEGDQAITGLELDALSDEELSSRLEKISVYARVSPENKIRIVEAWQNKGEVVAMTGDGVNDAPALKKADIGVAMGITGTDVAKEAAAMVLADDNFATIVKAVGNGRNIYRNISNSVKLLVSGNVSGVVAVLYASIMGLTAPFTAVQLLFINLLTDSLPALAISAERPTGDLLMEKPRDASRSILDKSFITQSFSQGLIIAAFALTAYYKGMEASDAHAVTMAFSTLCLARLFHGFNCRSGESLLKLGVFTNKYTVMSFVLGAILLAAALFIPPLQIIFQTVMLSGQEVSYVVICAFAPTLVIQLGRFFKDLNKKSL